MIVYLTKAIVLMVLQHIYNTRNLIAPDDE